MIMARGPGVQYQAILNVSRMMLEAGRAQEWESLLALEEQRRSMLAEVSTVGAQGARETADALKEILTCDKELIEKVDHWLQHARVLLRMPPGRDVS